MTKIKFTKVTRMASPKSPNKATPASAAKSEAEAAPTTKTASIVALLRRPGGAGMAELMATTGWQAHSVRGALSGAVKKQLKLPLVSEKTETGRVYRIVDEVAA